MFNILFQHHYHVAAMAYCKIKMTKPFRDFWEILYRLNEKGQKSLLRFITGSDRIPAGGFKDMIFKISRVNNPQM